jgi:hypothetical protein
LRKQENFEKTVVTHPEQGSKAWVTTRNKRNRFTWYTEEKRIPEVAMISRTLLKICVDFTSYSSDSLPPILSLRK